MQLRTQKEQKFPEKENFKTSVGKPKASLKNSKQYKKSAKNKKCTCRYYAIIPRHNEYLAKKNMSIPKLQ